MQGMVAQVDPGTDAVALTREYLNVLADGGNDPSFSDVNRFEDMPEEVDVAMGTVTMTASSGSGSYPVSITSVVSVRQADGLTVVGSLYYDPDSWDDQLLEEFAEMTFSMVDSQLA